MAYTPPASILIIGSGVFGLSTALSLAQNPTYNATKITLVDASPFPNPNGASMDSSRIIRSDYSSPLYASLAARGQAHWDDTSSAGLGGEGRYNRSGLLLTCENDAEGAKYVKNSYRNVCALVGEEKIKECESRESVREASRTGGASGGYGYLNTTSGWADAEKAMRWTYAKLQALNRVHFVTGKVTSLFYSHDRTAVLGARLEGGGRIEAILTILAAGAYTPTLIDLTGRAEATGQVIGYLRLSDEEQRRLENIPIQLSFTNGVFVIPPRNNILKVARHAYGYLNPVSVENHDGTEREASVPLMVGAQGGVDAIPLEAERELRECLAQMIPSLSPRPFIQTRICWYTDTPLGDFLIDYHPEFKGLLLATGGSGHGFKFLPVLGDEVVGVMEGKMSEIRELWKWRGAKIEGRGLMKGDGSRSGKMGVVLREELRRDRAGSMESGKL